MHHQQQKCWESHSCIKNNAETTAVAIYFGWTVEMRYALLNEINSGKWKVHSELRKDLFWAGDVIIVEKWWLFGKTLKIVMLLTWIYTYI